jgi:hypothetical protein
VAEEDTHVGTVLVFQIRHDAIELCGQPLELNKFDNTIVVCVSVVDKGPRHQHRWMNLVNALQSRADLSLIHRLVAVLVEVPKR